MEELKQQKGFFTKVKEMIGRVETDSFWSKIKATFSLFSFSESIDYSKVNYTLARSIYYACAIKDERSNKVYGEKYILGASFGKPIVNAATSFIMKEPVQITMDNSDEDLQDEINGLLKKENPVLTQAVRNSLREGDAYVLIGPELEFSLLNPELVEKIVNNLNINNIIGYDVSSYVSEDENSNQKTLYKTIYRKDLIEVRKYNGKNTYEVISSERNENGMLPIIHFANEPEPNSLYGNSEYQSCYNLMANYHGILSNAIKGDIFNSTPIPYITGITNMNEFKQANGTRQTDGTYQINWTNKKVLLGGEKTKFGTIDSQDTTGGSERLLNILFWGICQTSETPEFVMGTAVQSSKASTETQMPIMIAKAQRKQAVFTKPMRDLIDYLIDQLQERDTDTEYQVQWAELKETNEQLELDRAKLLSETQTASKSTIGKIAGLEKYITDIDEEIENAKNEYEQEATLFAPTGELKK